MDLDPFDDVFADQPLASRPGGRAGGKFQPKRNVKPRPKNPVPNPNPNPVPTPDPDPDPDPDPNQTLSSTILSNNQLNEKQGQFPPYSTNAGEWQSHIERSPGGKNCDVYIGLDSFEDSLPQTVTIPTETPTVQASNGQITEDGLMDPGSCNIANVHTTLEGPAQLDTLTGEDSAALIKGGTFHLESRTEEAESAEDFPCLNTQDFMSQPTSISGQRIGKSQHNAMLHPFKTTQSDMAPNPEETEYSSFADSVPSQTECMVETSGPAFPVDDVIDLSSIGFSDSIYTDPNSNFQANEETNWTETSHSDATLPGEHPEAVSEMPGKRSKRGRRKGPLSPLEKQVCRSSERLKKQINAFQLFDEPEDEGCNDNHGLENVDTDNVDPEYAVENEDTDNVDQENVVKNESLKGKPRSRSKKSDANKEKPVRKRKKSNEESVEPTKAPKKKFSHTTRRNKRRVNPDLLKIPEDEIDFHNLPLTTRIWLAEHKERMEKSEAKTLETPLMKQSFSVYHDEDEASHGRDSADEYGNSMSPETSIGINYHTHMKITPRARWSKQDTELFYEVLQQFGTDLAMIAECFPGRTRHQIKLKYKSEERRNPARLHDALATRSQGSSHFEVVIERLKQIAAQKQDDNGDDPINSTGEEAEEVAADVNEAAKSESHGENVQDMEPEDVPVPEVETSLKTDESEDDEFRWSQYKSEI